MADKEAAKQLRIKSGVVKRLKKEKEMYEKEAVEIEEKIEKMKEDGKDEYDIKKMGEVLQESKQMVPDTDRRLKLAVDDLDMLIEDKMEHLPEYKTAVEVRATIVA